MKPQLFSLRLLASSGSPQVLPLGAPDCTAANKGFGTFLCNMSYDGLLVTCSVEDPPPHTQPEPSVVWRRGQRPPRRKPGPWTERQLQPQRGRVQFRSHLPETGRAVSLRVGLPVPGMLMRLPASLHRQG